MKWLLAEYPIPSPTDFWGFLACMIFVGGLVAGYWAYRANRRKAEESNAPERRILPSPLITSSEDPFIRRSEFDAQVGRRNKQVIELEDRLTSKMSDHQKYVKDHFHEVRNDLQTIKKEGEERGAAMTQQVKEVSEKVHGVCEVVSGIRQKTNRIENIETKLDRAIEREIKR